MTRKTILYVGPDSGTSRHRCRALGRLGHDVELVDPFGAFAGFAFWPAWGFKTGYLGLERRIARHVMRAIRRPRYDVVWVDNGETVGAGLAQALKRRCDRMVNHNIDNPFAARDGRRWRLFFAALPHYDLFVTPRQASRAAAHAAGASRTLVRLMTADEAVHRPVELTEAERQRFGTEVAFVGTWMPERGPFMRRLIERGVPLRIFGPRWTKAPEHAALAPFLTAASLDDETYVKVIAAARIALGLLSSGNVDQHTTRSMEIPAIGTPLCAERSDEHRQLYRDGEEALFFDGPDECADLCLALLEDDGRRHVLGAAGRRRALINGHFNERICQDILDALDGGAATTSGPSEPQSREASRAFQAAP